MPLLPKDQDAYSNGRLSIPCSRIVLTQRVPDNAHVYEGPGFIEQGEHGNLQLRMFASVTRDEVKTSFMKWAIAGDRIGKFVPESDYYMMTATAISGHEWISERLNPSTHSGVKNVVMVSANFQRLERRAESHSSGSDISMIVHTDAKIPATIFTNTERKSGTESHLSSGLDAAEFEVLGLNVWLRKEENERLAVVARTAENELPESIVNRLIESLQFVLASSLHPSQVEVRTGLRESLTLYSPNEERRTSMHPPINWRHHGNPTDVWKLFECYLSHVIGHSEEHFHPISAWLVAARNASVTPVSLFSFGLTLGVAIEGVLKVMFVDDKVPAAVVEAIDSLLKHITTWEGSAVVRGRVEGSINMIRQPRALDWLLELQCRGVITDMHVKAWKKLRNAAAHAKLVGEDDMEEWLGWCYSAAALLYRLVLHHIGYDGPFTDYSVEGWPLVTFNDV